MTHEMTRGDRKVITHTIIDANGDRLDLTGKTLAFTAKRYMSDPQAEAIIAKTTGAGITHATQSGDTLGMADTEIDPADTVDLPSYAVALNYDLQLTDSGDPYTVETGWLLVFADVTTPT